MEKEKLFIDNRVGCIALRLIDDAKNEGNGLNSNMKSVVFYSKLIRDENITEENKFINDMVYEKINNLKARLDYEFSKYYFSIVKIED